MKHIVIPARFASTRLSGKPLLKIHGREMILRVVLSGEESWKVLMISASQRMISEFMIFAWLKAWM